MSKTRAEAAAHREGNVIWLADRRVPRKAPAVPPEDEWAYAAFRDFLSNHKDLGPWYIALEFTCL